MKIENKNYEKRLSEITEKVNKGIRVPIKDYSIYLRANATYAENLLFYSFLSRLPIRFKRQSIINNVFIADFACQKLNFIIEIDGSIHSYKNVYENDIKRENILNEWGYSVLRFQEYDVLSNLRLCADTVYQYIEKIMKEMNFYKDEIEFIINPCNLKPINESVIKKYKN